jgi:hypothetical protein
MARDLKSLRSGCLVHVLYRRPVLGYPLRYSQAQTLLEIIFPVFLGYLGAATQFVFQRTPSPDGRIAARPMMGLLVRGPIFLFCTAVIAAAAAFGYSNRAAAAPGVGMSMEVLTGTITAALGLLAVTTNVVVAYLLSVEAPKKEEQ